MSAVESTARDSELKLLHRDQEGAGGMSRPRHYPRMPLPGARQPELEVPPDQRLMPGSAFDPLDDMADEDEDFEPEDDE